MSQIKIAGATVNQTPLDWKNNLAHIVDAIAEAKTNGVQILCFPELAITSYNCEDLFLTYWLPKKASDQLKVIIPHTDGITVAVGLPVRLNTLLYNCVCMIKDGEILGFTAKQFLARDGVHYEPRWFDPWPANEVTSLEFDGKMYPFGDITYDLHGIKIGFEICEDAWRGDARPGYRLCDRKVDLIMNPSASHFAMAKSKIREDLVTESTLKFNCTYLFCNLLGNEAGRMIYDGETIIAKSGKIIAKNPLLSFEDFNLTIATVDFQDDSNNQYNPYLHHYDKNVEFADATSLALFDYMRKVKSQGFVLSLSGGADSAACAVLVAQMVRRGIAQLGPERFLNKLGFKDVFDLSSAYLEKDILAHILHTAYQSSNNSSKDTLESAQYLATSLGASFYQWEIASEVDSYTSKIEKAIGRTLNWEKDDIAMQNIQARSRSPIIWLLANLKNALLLTTSNRSEGDVGYTTMDGDTSGSIAPIAGVDKYFILRWLKWPKKRLRIMDSLKLMRYSLAQNLDLVSNLRPMSKT